MIFYPAAPVSQVDPAVFVPKIVETIGLLDGSKINVGLFPFRDPFLPPKLPAVLAEVSSAVSSVSRVTKRQGCSGLKDLAKTLGPSLGEEKSGRRLIRRVLSQVPGRTWEGKEELLEAVVALCAAGKGYAVALEPFFWGDGDAPGGGVGGGGLSSSSGSRGVKRTRSSDPVGSAGEEEVEEEEEQEEQEEAASAPQVGSDGAPGTTASMGSKGSGGGDRSASDDDGAVHDAGGTEEESAFEYEDKLGDLDTAASASASGAAAPAAGLSVRAQHNQQSVGSAASGEPRKDAALEDGLASLEVEDDTPIPFGEVVALMLSQLRR